MKKILVVSNEPFADTSSNGRTMKNFLLNVPKQNLAQFYLHGVPDKNFCENYFCVSDRAALNAFLCKKEKQQNFSGVPVAQGKELSKPKRSYRNLVLRNVVWQSMRWWKKSFTTFLDDFLPDIVLLQAGDAPFMYKIAMRIARKYNAKLVMYNSEFYVLKKIMYASSGQNMFWHHILMGSLKRQYRRFMKAVDYCLYNTEALEAEYQEKYPHPGKSAVLYTTSTLCPLPDGESDQFVLLYCGNLGVGRVDPINELAKVLFEVDKTARLDICGRFPNKESQAMVCANPNVVYHGFLEYSEILTHMSKSSMLVHCESNTRLENLKYAFSTKIADSLASTRPFLVYASGEYPFIQYLLKNQCAHVAENVDELKRILRFCIDNKTYRCQYEQNAHLVAVRNHDQKENCRRVEEIFNSI